MSVAPIARLLPILASTSELANHGSPLQRDGVSIAVKNDVSTDLYFQFGRVKHEILVQNSELFIASTVEIEQGLREEREILAIPHVPLPTGTEGNTRPVAS